jgi:hypothetical protein
MWKELVIEALLDGRRTRHMADVPGDAQNALDGNHYEQESP